MYTKIYIEIFRWYNTVLALYEKGLYLEQASSVLFRHLFVFQDWNNYTRIFFFSRTLQCKTNTIPILMHQMRISTTKVSSVILRPKKLEIRKTLWTLYMSRKKQILCHEIEPNLSKDRAMHEGDNHHQLS
jgi:hypothetical protein